MAQHKDKPYYGWLMWFIATLFYGLDYFQHTAPSVLIRPIAHAMHINFVAVGNIMSIYFPVYAIAQIPAGYLLDKYKLRHVLAVACLVVSIGLLMMMKANLEFIFWGRVLIAMGSAFAFLGALKTASIYLSDQLFPLAVGLTNMIGVAGGILGQPVLNKLIMHIGWQESIGSIFIVGLILTAILFFTIRHKSSSNYRMLKPFSLSIFNNRALWMIAIYAGIMVGTVVNAFSELYDVVFLENTLNISSQLAAETSMMVFVGIGVGGPLHGIISQYFKDPLSWLKIGCVLTILSFMTLVILSNLHVALIWYYVLYFCCGFFVSSMLLGFSAIRLYYQPSHHGIVFAFINMIIGLSGYCFQRLLGLIISTTRSTSIATFTFNNYDKGLIMLLLSLLVALTLVLLLPKHQSLQH